MGYAKNVKLSELAHFTDRQMEAVQCVKNHRFLLYGGARGGGKSYFLRWFLLLFVIDHPGVTVGLFCNTFPELKDRQISKMAEEFPEYLGAIRDRQDKGLGFYLHERLGGGLIALRNLDDVEKYRSAEFAAIGDDEVTLHDLETFNFLRGSLRWAGLDRPVYVGGTNPGGKGHGWVKDFWIDRAFPKEMAGIKNEFAFVRSLPSDNPYLAQTYWDDLNSLPPNLSRAWVYGDWDIFEGQAFQFNRERHVINRMPNG